MNVHPVWWKNQPQNLPKGLNYHNLRVENVGLKNPPLNVGYKFIHFESEIRKALKGRNTYLFSDSGEVMGGLSISTNPNPRTHLKRISKLPLKITAKR